MMNRSMKSVIASTLLAIGALGAAAGAHAGTSIHVSIGTPHAHTPVHVQQQPVVVPVVHGGHAPVYEVYDSPREHARERHYARDAARCGAPRWDPDLRYMPGQAVWRKGELFVARRVSASVWNVNSPPEWTPQYWVEAQCGR
jgi:hypothetical protein